MPRYARGGVDDACRFRPVFTSAAAEVLLDAYRDGVWLAALAPLADPALPAGAVAAVLRVREEPGRTVVETLASHLRERRPLLVLDNCEHLRAARAELVGTLLGAAPGLLVLATGRAPLGLAEERRLAVPPLALPASGEVGLEAVAGTPAVALFVASAQAVEPAFALDEGNAAALGEEGFAAAWAEGRALSQEEAIALALEGQAPAR